MKLRSGFSYSYENILKTPVKQIKTESEIIKNVPKKKSIKKRVKPIIKINKNLRCAICQEEFKKNDLICSCAINNINKHCFHKECLKFWINDLKRNGKKIFCPYCTNDLPNRLKYVKIQ